MKVLLVDDHPLILIQKVSEIPASISEVVGKLRNLSGKPD